MNVQATLAELLETDARMAALKARRDELRSTLAEEATRRYREDGAVPSWKVPRLGSATLAGTDSTTTEVADEARFADWAREERPESVVYELAIPATAVDDHAEALASLEGAPGVSALWRVHPGVLAGIVAMGRLDPDSGRLISEDGHIIPGVVVRRKEPYLSVRLDAEAKRRALAQVAPVPESQTPTGEADLRTLEEVVDDAGGVGPGAVLADIDDYEDYVTRPLRLLVPEQDTAAAQEAVGSPGPPESWVPAQHIPAGDPDDAYVDPFLMALDPTYQAPMPARHVVCDRCGSLVPELAEWIERHTEWHREPELIPGPVVGNLPAGDPGVRRA